ncbi:MAG TPA: hypothetical protein VGB03_02935 [Acidimicrobiales bacterium]
MTAEHEEWIGRIRGLVISLEDAGILSSSECEQVTEYVDHGEAGDGVRLLAWIIVEEGKKVPVEVVDAIESLSEDVVLPEHMPPTLRDHVV